MTSSFTREQQEDGEDSGEVWALSHVDERFSSSPGLIDNDLRTIEQKPQMLLMCATPE